MNSLVALLVTQTVGPEVLYDRRSERTPSVCWLTVAQRTQHYRKDTDCVLADSGTENTAL